MSFLTKERTLSLKTAAVIFVIGLVIFAAGIGMILYNMSPSMDGENSLTFERTVTAQITGCRISEHTRSHKKAGGTGFYTTVESRDYIIDFLVTIGGGTYGESQNVTRSVYDKYSALEKNTDTEWKLYRNPDGAAFLSLDELPGAQAEYTETGYITENTAMHIIAGMVTAFIGWGVLIAGAKARGRAKKAQGQHLQERNGAKL